MTAEAFDSSAARRAAFLHCPELEQYHYPAQCPFSAQRAGQTRKMLASMGLLTGAGHWEAAPTPADRATLLTFHSAKYIDALEKAPLGYLDVEGLFMGLGSEDCPIFPGMLDYASLACGASLAGARLLLAGEADVAFNPSGGYHHAHRSMAGGFCYVNDVVLACMALTHAGRRVVFLDLDAHHCDGVQDAFYDRADVMTISLHESGETLYPGTGFSGEIGTGAGEGYSANVPLPVDLHDEGFLYALDQVAMPLIGAYNPDVIVMELGMDMLAGDPLTHLELTNNAYADAIERVLATGKPILAVGGGGYHVANTARGWALAWTVLCGADDHADQMALGMGGVMLESTDWAGGLRDRRLAPAASTRIEVGPPLVAAVAETRAHVFPHHGL